MEPFFKHVAVPLDASGSAMNALRMAETMHRRFDARLTVIHVNETGEEENPSRIKELVSAHQKDGVLINFELRNGSIYKNIVKAAEDIQADLVVMGTHGVFGFQQLWMGSNAFRVVSSSHCPVITVQEHFTHSSISNIVLPIDTSSETRQKVPLAARLAKSFDATIHIFGVSTDKDDEAQKYVKRYSSQVEEYLDKHGVKYIREQQLGGNITNNTINYARQKDADLIVIMTEQEPNGTAFFMGKFAQQMVHNSPIPVMSIRPKDKGGNI